MDKFQGADKTMKASRHNKGKNCLFQYLPILEWLPQYQFSWLRADLIAGLTIWAVMVPEAMAYAGIARVPPIIGLYTVPIPLFLYALLGTSRTMVIGPDSATALISSVTVGAVAASGSSEYLTLTSAIAMVAGILFLAFGLLKMGWVADFIPVPVMKGFIQGLVWLTIIGQVPKIFGITGDHGNFWEKLSAILHQLPQSHILTTIIGLGSLGLLLILKKFLPKVPGALTTAIAASVAVSTLGLEDKGVELVGALQTGLPPLTIPAMSLDKLRAIVPGALAIVLLGYSESLGAAKAAAEKTGGEFDPNQELVSYGSANLGTALSSGFIVVGSLSKTSVAMEVGSKTQLSSVVCGGGVLLTLLFLMPLFQNLSHATLAAIVIEAMLGLANFIYFQHLRRIDPLELIIAMTTFFGVLFLGVLQGIGFGVTLSLVLLIYQASHPGTAVLGKLPGEQMYRDILLHPEAATIPGLLIFRFDNSLIFPNANYFRSQLKEAIRRAPLSVTEVLIDAESINMIDTTAMEMFSKLRKELSQKGIILSLARVRDSVRDRMKRAGLESEIGASHFYERISDGVEAFVQRDGGQ
jgi:high affinity sulfate transporter 1